VTCATRESIAPRKVELPLATQQAVIAFLGDLVLFKNE
jgi:hypothetical protein